MMGFYSEFIRINKRACFSKLMTINGKTNMSYVFRLSFFPTCPF